MRDMREPQFTLSIDPGIRGCGVALWNWGYIKDGLIQAKYICGSKGKDVTRGSNEKNVTCGSKEKDVTRSWYEAGLGVDALVRSWGGVVREVIIEWPQIYRHSKGDPNDLLLLAGVAGIYTQKYSHSSKIVLYKPAQWKGQIPKPIHHKRIIERLGSAIDRVELPKNKKLQADVWDAVGLGLYHLGKVK